MFTCQRPLVNLLGDAAACAYCGAGRGEPCRGARLAGPELVREPVSSRGPCDCSYCRGIRDGSIPPAPAAA